MSEATKRVLMRFLRGGIATAVTTMVLTIPANVSSLGDIMGWLNVLAVAAIFGFVSGGLLAADKYFRDSKS